MRYDSKPDTLEHIARVTRNITIVMGHLADRSVTHDRSKLREPEKSIFDEWSPKLRELTYGSEEYKAALKEMSVALQHHYANNSHHPEHYEDGIGGMTLLDVVEMFCDWQAASERHADGNFEQSLEINCKRFEVSDQLASIFKNTSQALGWI